MAVAFAETRAARADAGSLYAPYVVFTSGERAELRLTDRMGGGALVRIHLLDRNGQPVRRAGHPIVVTRAIPPGESVDVDLGAFWSASFDGVLRLDATGEVGARLLLPALHYDLVGSAESVRCEWTATAGEEAWIAVQNTVDRPNAVREIDEQGLEAARTLAPSASFVSSAGGKPGTRRIEASAAVAVLVVVRPSAGAWRLGSVDLSGR
jgi:hypothetical protein